MTEVIGSTPVDQLRGRLDDPKVAASLNLLLDNIDALALAALSLNGFLQRADTISDNLAGSMTDVRAIGRSLEFLAAPTKRLAQDAPQIADAAEALLESGMFSREVVSLLGRFARAFVEGAETAVRRRTSLSGPVAVVRALRDPDVARGLGLLLEISRSLGRTL